MPGPLLCQMCAKLNQSGAGVLHRSEPAGKTPVQSQNLGGVGTFDTFLYGPIAASGAVTFGICAVISYKEILRDRNT